MVSGKPTDLARWPLATGFPPPDGKSALCHLPSQASKQVYHTEYLCELRSNLLPFARTCLRSAIIFWALFISLSKEWGHAWNYCISLADSSDYFGQWSDRITVVMSAENGNRCHMSDAWKFLYDASSSYTLTGYGWMYFSALKHIRLVEIVDGAP